MRRSTTASASPTAAGANLKGAEQKLRNLEVPDAVLEQLRKTGEPVMSIDWPSPADGYVMKKNLIEGQMVRMGEEVFRIAGLEKIWVIADVSEQDIGLIAIGQPATLRFKAFPSETFKGRVTFVLHELDMATRTGQGAHRDRQSRSTRSSTRCMPRWRSRRVRARNRAWPFPTRPSSTAATARSCSLARGEGRFEPRAVTLGLQRRGLHRDQGRRRRPARRSWWRRTS